MLMTDIDLVSGWGDFWEEIELCDLVEGRHAKILG